MRAVYDLPLFGTALLSSAEYDTFPVKFFNLDAASKTSFYETLAELDVEDAHPPVTQDPIKRAQLVINILFWTAHEVIDTKPVQVLLF